MSSIFKETANTFEGQEEGENVILLIRRHPFFIILRVIVFIFLAIIPLAVGSSFAEFLWSNGLSSLFFSLMAGWLFFLWIMLFYALTMYTLDVWIVTDRRVIDSTQHGFFNRTTSELHISRIQDISVRLDGVVQTWFKFGDLQIQTAGTEEKFFFKQIPNPEETRMKISALAHAQHPPSSAGFQAATISKSV